MASLTATQKKELGVRLRARRTQLLEALETDLRDLGLDAHAQRAREVLDSGDAAMADFIGSLDAELAQRHSAALEATQQALDRLDTDRYGLCESCGIAMPLARLAAEPTARRCVPCQARFEQSQPPPRTF